MNKGRNQTSWQRRGNLGKKPETGRECRFEDLQRGLKKRPGEAKYRSSWDKQLTNCYLKLAPLLAGKSSKLNLRPHVRTCREGRREGLNQREGLGNLTGGEADRPETFGHEGAARSWKMNELQAGHRRNYETCKD